MTLGIIHDQTKMHGRTHGATSLGGGFDRASTPAREQGEPRSGFVGAASRSSRLFGFVTTRKSRPPSLSGHQLGRAFGLGSLCRCRLARGAQFCLPEHSTRQCSNALEGHFARPFVDSRSNTGTMTRTKGRNLGNVSRQGPRRDRSPN